MSTTAIKRPLADALADARYLQSFFKPETFERWEFAGSIRRRVASVGDVEHVILPRTGDVSVGGAAAGSLFAEMRTMNLVIHQLDELERTGVISKHVYGTHPTSGQPMYRWGEKYRGFDFKGHMHEVFCADHDNWGPTLAIRTGPGTFSKMLVTHLQRYGYINEGGYVRDKNRMACAGAGCGWTGRFVDLTFLTPEQWVRERPGNGKTPKWLNGKDLAGICPGCGHDEHLAMRRVSVPDEKTYFALCGVRWAEPWERRDVAP